MYYLPYLIQNDQINKDTNIGFFAFYITFLLNFNTFLAVYIYYVRHAVKKVGWLSSIDFCGCRIVAWSEFKMIWLGKSNKKQGWI